MKGNYSGTLEINDSIVSESAVIQLIELSNDVIQLKGDWFESYELVIDKKRYFASVSYYAVETDEQLEVYNDGTITISHNDGFSNYFIFYGSKE